MKAPNLFERFFSCKSSLSNRGFSLVEVLVATGIVSIVSLGIASLYNTMNRQSVYMDTKLDRQSLQRSIETMLSRPASCAVNLSPGLGATPSHSLTVLNQTDDSGTVINSIIPALNSPIFAGSKLSVSQIQITGSDGTGTPSLLTTTAAEKVYLAGIKVTFNEPVGGGVVLKPLVIPSVSISTNLSDVFQSCQVASTSSPAATCNQLGLFWNETDQECLPSANRACELLGGIMIAGKCIPSTMVNFGCPVGQTISGFSATGTPECAVTGSGPTSPPTRTCRTVLSCRCYIARTTTLTCNMTIPSCYSYYQQCN